MCQQVRHRQALAPLISCHPFLLVSQVVTRMALRTHKSLLASVFNFALRPSPFASLNLTYCYLDRPNLGVSTSVSALEISDLPAVSVPAVGVSLV